MYEEDDYLEHHQSPGPAPIPTWILTYADLMSLLLAFFVLMFSFSEMDRAQYKIIGGTIREAFGVQNKVEAHDRVLGNSYIADQFSPGKPEPTVENSVRQQTSDVTSENLKVEKGTTKDPLKNEHEDELDRHKEQSVPEAINQMMETRQAEKQALQFTGAASIELADDVKNDQVEIERKETKVILRVRETSLFNSGEAEILPQFHPLVTRLGKLLLQSGGKSIAIAGHADDRPIKTSRFRSNWELSASRAVSVLHEISQSVPLDLNNISVEGFSSYRPIASNDSEDGRARNRRVEIIVNFNSETK
ncbi:MAG: MotB family protein [bacterium]|nr:MotB family protein [bacterium]